MGVSESMYPVRYNPSSTLLPDEEVVCRDYAEIQEIQHEDSFLSGTVFLTNYRFLFVEFSQVGCRRRGTGGRALTVARRQHGRRGRTLATPVCTVATVEESQEGNPDLRLLIVSLKQLLTLRMRVPPKLAYHRLLELGSGVARDPPRLAVAWADRPHWRRDLQHHINLRRRAGGAIPHSWWAFDAVTEFTRMGLVAGPEPAPWRITHQNTEYTLCESYPDLLVVPATADDAQLRRVAAFRARGRVPCATYRHPNGAAILRSSQPLVGLMRARSADDEAYLQAVCDTVPGRADAKVRLEAQAHQRPACHAVSWAANPGPSPPRRLRSSSSWTVAPRPAHLPTSPSAPASRCRRTTAARSSVREASRDAGEASP